MSLHDHGMYRLVVHGRVEPGFAEVFDRFVVEELDDTCALLGPVRDQAELQGILQLLIALNLTVLSVERFEPTAA